MSLLCTKSPQGSHQPWNKSQSPPSGLWDPALSSFPTSPAALSSCSLRHHSGPCALSEPISVLPTRAPDTWSPVGGTAFLVSATDDRRQTSSYRKAPEECTLPYEGPRPQPFPPKCQPKANSTKTEQRAMLAYHFVCGEAHVYSTQQAKALRGTRRG